jgi:hypothetical protein
MNDPKHNEQASSNMMEVLATALVLSVIGYLFVKILFF